jgi:hypothetical protein
VGGRRAARAATAIFRRRAAGTGTTPGDRGFALLFVLWTMVLLSLIGTRIASSGRAVAQLATSHALCEGVVPNLESSVCIQSLCPARRRSERPIPIV